MQTLAADVGAPSLDADRSNIITSLVEFASETNGMFEGTRSQLRLRTPFNYVTSGGAPQWTLPSGPSNERIQTASAGMAASDNGRLSRSVTGSTASLAGGRTSVNLRVRS